MKWVRPVGGVQTTSVVLDLAVNSASERGLLAVAAAMGGEAGASIQKVFGYGVRNSLGLDIDRRSGSVWVQENGDDSFTELNRVADAELERAAGVRDVRGNCGGPCRKTTPMAMQPGDTLGP